MRILPTREEVKAQRRRAKLRKYRTILLIIPFIFIFNLLLIRSYLKARGPDSSKIKLSKNVFLVSEDVQIELGNYEPEDISIEFFDSNGSKVKFNSEHKDGKLFLKPGVMLRPGKFKIKISDDMSNLLYEESFSWGVLAINTNKSPYMKNETADFFISVLDDRGNTVCDAKINLSIKDPDGKVTNLSTDDETVLVGESCTKFDFSMSPDYEAFFKVAGEGVYEITLDAKTQGGDYSIVDRFEVRSSVDFDIERSAPVRIYPPKQYQVNFTVKVNRDFDGFIEEYVPTDFEILDAIEERVLNPSEQTGAAEDGGSLLPGLETQNIAEISEAGGVKGIRWSVSWKAGEVRTLRYIFEAPEFSPQSYLLGPISLFEGFGNEKTYMELRKWRVASDSPEAEDTPFVWMDVDTSLRSANESTLANPSEMKVYKTGGLVRVAHKQLELATDKTSFTGKETPHFTLELKPSILQRAESLIGRLLGRGWGSEVTVFVRDNKGNVVKEFKSQVPENGKTEIIIEEEWDLPPGKYTIEISQDDALVSQDFTWGVLAFNTNKSIYLPEDEAKISMAVLDDEGNMVCDANVSLEITDPLGGTDILSTGNNLIKVNPECQEHSYTERPDYEAKYPIGSTGTYSVKLTATTINGTRVITDKFYSQESVEFDVDRSGPTRIFPPASYAMRFTVVPKTDYKGEVREALPADIAVLSRTVQEQNDEKITETLEREPIIEQEGKRQYVVWNVDWKKDETYVIDYTFKTPDVSPAFYLVGPLQIGDFSELRQWQLAIDATETQFGANSTSVCGDASCPTSWSDPSNVQADDGSYAKAAVKFKNQAGNPMERIKTQDMGFTAVTGVIGDIVVELQGNDTQANNGCNDYDARLLNDTGTEVGPDKSRGTGVHWGTTESIWTYTWTSAEHGLTAAQIQDVDFGFYIDVEADANSFCQPRLDYIKITVNYTPSVTLGGTVYTNEGTTNIGINKTVDLRVDGAGTYTDETDASGVWSISGVTLTTGQVITAYIDDEIGQEGTTILVSDGTAKSDIDIYQNTVIVRHDTGTSITPDNMYAGDDGDDDVKYLVSASSNGNLTVDSGFELHVWTGDTFDASGGAVTTQGSSNLHVDDSAITTLDTSGNIIAGDIVVDDAATVNINNSTTINGGDITVTSGGDVASSAGIVTMGASGTIGGGSTGSTFQLTNLTVSSGTTTLGSDADNILVFNGDISVSTGAGLAMNSKTADINGGNLTTSGTGTVTCSSCTGGGVTLSGDGSTNGIGGGGSVTVYSLTLDGSSNTTNAGSLLTVMHTLTTNSSRTLGMGGFGLIVGDLGVTGSGIIAGSGDITQTGSSTRIQSSDNSTASTVTVTSGSYFAGFSIGSTNDNTTYTVNLGSNLDINNDLNISDAGVSDTHTLSAAGYQITVGFSWTNNDTFSAGTSTVVMDATTGSRTITSGGSAFNNLSIDNGGTAITWTLQDTLDVNGNLLIDTSNTLDANSGGPYNINVAGNWTNNGTYTARSNTTVFDGAAGTTQAVSGSSTFNHLSATASGTRVITFAASSTTTIAASANLTLTGTSCTALLILRSATSGTQWTLTDNTGGTTSVSYVDVQDSNATNAVTASNSVNSGNNTNWTIAANSCKGGSLSTNATAYSFQRKTIYDGTNARYWLFYYDGNQIDIRYTSDAGSTWSSISSLAYNTNDFSVWNAKISTTEYVWLAVATSNDILIRRGTLGASSITWDTEANVVALDGSGASDDYSYPYFSLDSSNYMWVIGRYYDGTNYVMKAVRSDVNDTGDATWSGVGFGTTITVRQISDDQTNANVFGNVVPLASQDMYAAFVTGTALEGCRWDSDQSGGARWEDSSDASCEVTSGGAGDTEGSSTRSSTVNVKIDDAGDPETIADSSRHIVQSSEGTLYTAFNDGGSCEVWTSTDGSSWNEVDSNDNPLCGSTSDIAVAVDSSDILHIAYEDDSSNAYNYITVTTSDNQFGLEETIDSSIQAASDVFDISVDVNDVPHFVYEDEVASDLYYTNRVSGSWKSQVAVNTSIGLVDYISTVINKNNVIEIATMDTSQDVFASRGNLNDATSFENQTIDTITSGFNVSIVVDSEGNTWLGYQDFGPNNVTLIKHNKGDAWTTWQTPITNSNVGGDISMSAVGKTIFVFYIEDSTDTRVAYDTYDGGTGAWLGEKILATPGAGGDFIDVRVRYSNYNFHEPWVMDFLYSDWTDIYWNYVDLRPTKIDDASDFGTLPGAGRQIVRTKSGDYYSFLNDGGNCEMWKSSDGYNWEQQATGTTLTCDSGDPVATAIDGQANQDIHVTYLSGANVRYRNFDTATDAWDAGGEETVKAFDTVAWDVSIAVDSSNVPHITSYGDDTLWIEIISYSNRVGGTPWSGVDVEPQGVSGDLVTGADITINDSNIPELALAFFDSSNYLLKAYIGNTNDATSFTQHTVDAIVTISSGQSRPSIAVNTLTGDTWIAYVDDNTGTKIALAKHTGSTWTSNWSTITTKTDIGSEPSIAIAGSSDVYVFYQEDSTDQKIAYDVYDSDAASPAWDGETVLQTPGSGVDYRDVKAKWSFEWNNYGANRIDYLFSDGTDVYWDYLYLRRSPTNIDNASDFLFLSSVGRQVVRTSGGILYAVIDDAGSTEVWKSADNGNSWSQQDSADSPASHTAQNRIAVAIDSSDTLHILYTIDTGAAPDEDLRYITFTTSDNQFGSTEDVNTPGGSGNESIAIAIDSNDVPHIAVAEYNGTLGDGGISYNNRVGGSWIGTAVEIENITAEILSVDIAISDENIPEVIYVEPVGNDLTAAQGADNDPDTAGQWTLHDVDTDVVDTLGVTSTSIGIDSSGNTWVAYIDETGTDDYITLTKHADGTTWNSDANWTVVSEQSSLSNNKVGLVPSMAVDGSNIYIFYEDDQDDIVYDKYNGTSWSGETLLEEHGALQDVKARWSFINNYDSTGTARVQTNTYYFDNSDDCSGGSSLPCDAQSVWTDDTLTFNTDTSDGASTSTVGSTSSNFLQGDGTSAPTSGDTITSVKARMLSEASGGDPIPTATIYTNSLGESLGQITGPASPSGWGAYSTLSTPSGGWTWQKVNDLEVKTYCTGTLTACSVYKIEILVESTNTVAQAEIDYVYSDGTDVFYNRLSLGGATPGTQDAIDTGTGVLTDNLSAVADSSGNVHLIFIDDETTDQVSYKKWNGTSWSSAILVADAADGDDAYVSLSIDTTGTDALYALWIDTVDSDIFYADCALSTNCDLASEWDAETGWKTSGTNTHVTSNYSGASRIYAMWSDGATMPSVQWDTILVPAGNTAPDSPTSLTQKRVTAGTTMAIGDWTNETQVQFTASATDTDNPDTLYLCVEKDILGTTFSNTEDLCGTGVAYSGTAVTVTVTITGMTDASEYHWQARVKDAASAYSSWVSFGSGNPESERDYGIDTTAPTGGTVYDGTSVGVDLDFSTTSLSELSANWDSFSATVSGLLRYDYSIGTTQGGTDIKDWTSNSATTSVTASSLTLQTSKPYYFNVRAVDNAGNVQSAVSSDGQVVTPSLTFSVSPSTITFNNLNAANSYNDTETVTLTTSTNAYNGYVIRSYITALLTSTIYPSYTIPNFNGGSYASPDEWLTGDRGFGYTSSDTSVQGSNIFNGTPCPGGGNPSCYAPFSLTGPGDIVADHTATVSGSPISGEQFTITYQVKTDTTQQASPYSTTVVYTITAIY